MSEVASTNYRKKRNKCVVYFIKFCFDLLFYYARNVFSEETKYCEHKMCREIAKTCSQKFVLATFSAHDLTHDLFFTCKVANRVGFEMGSGKWEVKLNQIYQNQIESSPGKLASNYIITSNVNKQLSNSFRHVRHVRHVWHVRKLLKLFAQRE